MSLRCVEIISAAGAVLERIATSTVRHYSSRPCDCLHVVCTLMLSILGSFSMMRVHVCLGQQERRFQWLGNPLVTERDQKTAEVPAQDGRQLSGWFASTLQLRCMYACELCSSLFKHHC